MNICTRILVHLCLALLPVGHCLENFEMTHLAQVNPTEKDKEKPARLLSRCIASLRLELNQQKMASTAKALVFPSCGCMCMCVRISTVTA